MTTPSTKTALQSHKLIVSSARYCAAASRPPLGGEATPTSTTMPLQASSPQSNARRANPRATVPRGIQWIAGARWPRPTCHVNIPNVHEAAAIPIVCRAGRTSQSADGSSSVANAIVNVTVVAAQKTAPVTASRPAIPNVKWTSARALDAIANGPAGAALMMRYRSWTSMDDGANQQVIAVAT